ncbi:MAG: hypothetical protein JWN07_1052 [Hyphomicrobiales bacterium]|nr:hypothetical protein [Hyphomicrobiales bacterium]
MFARLILTVIGLACASAAALLFLPFAVLVDPLVQGAASQFPADRWIEILESLFLEDDPQEAVTTLVQLIWTVGMLVCVVPIIIVALVGGVARARSFLFYAGLTGAFAAAMPWVLRASRFAERGGQMSSAEGHLTLILFLTGVVAGTIYWLIAARGDGSVDRAGWLSGQKRG